MKAEITTPLNPVPIMDEYTIHLVPESNNESKLLSVLFEKFAIEKDGLSFKRNRNGKIFYSRTQDGSDTTKLEITVLLIK